MVLIDGFTGSGFVRGNEIDTFPHLIDIALPASVTGTMKTERYVWITLLMAVAAWGATRGGARPAQDHTGDTGSPSSRTASPRRMADRSAESRAMSPARRESRATGSPDSHVTQALHRTDPLERMAGWLQLLSACDGKRIDRVMEAWEKRKAAGIALPAEEKLLNFRLGQLKGGEVLADHSGTPEDFERLDLLKSRFEGWLEADPSGADRWLEQLPTGKFRDQMALAVIAHSVREQPEAAMRQVAGLPEHLQRKAGEAAGTRLRETGSIEEASAFLGNLGGGPGDASYLNGILETLIGGADDPVLQLVEQHLAQPYVTPGTLEKVSVAKGKADPLAALEWAVEIEEKKSGLPQGSLLVASIREMDLEDLAKAEQWGNARAGWPGTAEMLATVEARKRLLEDRGEDSNEYDHHD